MTKKIPDQQRQKELHDELERQRERFLTASRKGLHALREDLSIPNWIASYPVEASIIAFLGGLLIGMSGSPAASKPLDQPETSS